MNRIGDGPIEQKYRTKMNELCTVLDAWFNGDARGVNRKVGFVMMIFNFNDDAGRCNYISNAQRLDVEQLLREQLKRFEEQRAGNPSSTA